MFWRGLFASVLGSSIGIMLALSAGVALPGALVHGLIGGLLAYVSYDFERARQAAPSVWREVSRQRNIDWAAMELPLRLKKGAWAFLAGVSVMSTVCVFGLIVEGKFQAVDLKAFLDSVLLVTTTVGGMMGLAFFLQVTHYSDDTEALRSIAKDFNPVYVIFWVSVRGVPLVWNFVTALLKEIYLEVRLVAGISAFSGVLLGWWHHDLAEGVALTAVVFVFQYLLIHLPLKRRATAR